MGVGPNYCIAIRLTNPKLKERLYELQRSVIGLAHGSFRADSIINADMFHITLSVLHLPDDESVLAAIEAITQFGRTLLQELVTDTKPCHLQIAGIGLARSRKMRGKATLYTEIADCQGLKTLGKIYKGLSNIFSVLGISKQSKKFHPHISLFKFRGRDTKSLPLQELSRRLASSGKPFGLQPLHQLDLCYLGKPSSNGVKSSGYYPIVHSVRPLSAVSKM